VRPVRLLLAILPLAAGLAGCTGVTSDNSVPLCPGPDRNSGVLFLMAQAVPSTAYVPCISDMPGGWSLGGERIRNGRSEFWLDSDRAGSRALTVLLTPSCETSKAVEVPPDVGEPQMRRFEEPTVLPPAFSGNSYYVFPGGCVTYQFAFAQGASFAQAVEMTESLTFVSRALGVKELAKEGLVLCGRGAGCPG
jgi:hypothetical protein